ncbi:MAG TPA: two-component regulator propeller domain-containing protein [Anaerolineales bacterium]|nr:two-component regulator propeller domain-containing protein [Anaerolineales bacterium]
MKPTFHLILLFILSLVFVSLACQGLSGTQPANTPAPQQTEAPQQPASTEAPIQASVEPATVDSQGAGILCVGSGTGLSCINESGWQIYTDENSDLPNNYLYAGAVCPDGQLAIAHISGVVLFDGTSSKQIPETDTYSSPEGIACDANGEIWVAHFQGVSRYAGGQWRTYGSDQLASGESANELVYDVEVAPDGKVWVLTSRSVAMFENETWTVFQEGQGFSESRFFNAIALDAKGRPWAAHSTGVDVFENGVWQSISKTDFNTPESLAVDSKGNIWFGTISDGVYLFDGNTWVHHDKASEALRSNYVTSLSSDSSGRVWLGTSYGLSVFDGAKWQTYLMSNSSLADNDIEFVIVTKDGPALPATEDKENGSLTGTIHKADGTPLAEAVVEICVETIGSTFYGDTPCSDQPVFFSTTTDANGNFSFGSIPSAYYVIVADTGDGSWAQLTDEFGISSERTLIQPGEQYDLGTLTLEN